MQADGYKSHPSGLPHWGTSVAGVTLSNTFFPEERLFFSPFLSAGLGRREAASSELCKMHEQEI